MFRLNFGRARLWACPSILGPSKAAQPITKRTLHSSPKRLSPLAAIGLSPNALFCAQDESALAQHEQDLLARLASSKHASSSHSPAISSASTEYPYGIYSYVARIQYDGHAFKGLQSQGGAGPSTVQYAVERALSKVFKEPDAASFYFKASGRTDAGVHGLDQHIQFFTQRPWLETPVLTRESDQARRLVLALNSCLPPEVRVFEVYQSAPDFSVRYDALVKTYYYYVNSSSIQSPFLNNRRYFFPKEADYDRAAEAWAAFEGEHNFWAFSSASPDMLKRDTIRYNSRCKVTPVEGGYCFAVTGTGFLYRQVRHLVGAAIAVGRGKLTLERLRELLALPEEFTKTAPRSEKQTGEWQAAPPEGLYLRSVLYPPGHDNPLTHFHPELPHQEDGRVAGDLVRADEAMGPLIQQARRKLVLVESK